MIEIEWFKIYKNTISVAKVISPKGEEYLIDIDYYNNLVKGDYPTRLDYENAVVEKLPKELPLEVRKYIIFSYIWDF